ncbi:hypothetical protein BHYA_0221g00060 [Botrytis hyacinthi]|uniref:Uncharacterized protein n=1 Tax=Botrytis hyacinthi TaxID=278943 RepID=A0A4Z1GAF4_9HELO|nr:hypothetical protein BHYA_0221g00060 [Botrytis hyacinthi]
MAHENSDTPTAHKISNNNLRCLNRDGQVIEFLDQQLYQDLETGGKSGGKTRNNMQLNIYWLPHTLCKRPATTSRVALMALARPWRTSMLVYYVEDGTFLSDWVNVKST